jgi:hypothetical protein
MKKMEKIIAIQEFQARKEKNEAIDDEFFRMFNSDRES